MKYETEMVKATDFVSKPCPSTEEKYVVECGYCGETFTSSDFSKAVTREGIHRAEKHVNKYTKITKAKADYNPNYSIVNDWFTVQLHNIDIIWYTTKPSKLTKFSQKNSFPCKNIDKPINNKILIGNE